MAKQDINYGTALDDESADSTRDAFIKTKENFDELYAADIVQTSDVDALEKITENEQTDNYTLVLTDNLKLVTVTTAGASTLTVPPNSSVAFPIGAVIMICQGGAGTVTITAGAGVTINSVDSALALTGQWATCTLIKRKTDTWLCTGSLQ